VAGERMAARYNDSCLDTNIQRKIMIHTIETRGRTALTEKSDIITRLKTDQYLRDTVVALRLSASGTFRTWRNVRVESAFGGNAEVAFQDREDRF
jgi:hypothetical protein